MPYSLSHAAVALPISLGFKGRIPLASIIVGSLAPDFPYLIALAPTQAPGHSLFGVLVYCLIPSLLLLLIWYRFLEHSNLALFGLPKRKWLFNQKQYFYIVIGVLLGAYSHVLWDATSHATGIFVVGSSFFNREVLSLPIYKWNQYLSGVLGLFTLLFWYLGSAYRYRNQEYKSNWKLGIICFSFSFSILTFTIVANILHHYESLALIVLRSSIAVIVGAFFWDSDL